MKHFFPIYSNVIICSWGTFFRSSDKLTIFDPTEQILIFSSDETYFNPVEQFYSSEIVCSNHIEL